MRRRLLGTLTTLAVLLVLTGCAGQLEQLAAADFAAAAQRGQAAQRARLLSPDDPYVACASAGAQYVQVLADVLAGDVAGVVDAGMKVHIRREFMRGLSPVCAKVILELEAKLARRAIGGVPFLP